MDFNLELEARKNIVEIEKIKFEKHNCFYSNVGIEKQIVYKDKKAVLCENGLNQKQIIELVLRKNVDSVVQNSLQPLTEKMKTLAEIDQDPNQFFNESFLFFPKNEGVHKIIFNSATSRQSIINLTFHRLGFDVESNRALQFRSALEEMIMNTQIDAKTISTSNVDKKSILIIEKNEKLAAISMIDFYGSLINSKFLAPIESCLNIGVAESINQNRQRGAGIGGSIIFNAADSIYLGCINGVKTRVTAILPLNVSERIQEKLQKSIILI